MALAAIRLNSSMEAFNMMINRKMLALLTAAVLGAGLAACQREEDRSASSQDSAKDQAPRQGYTGPGSPSTSPPSSSSGGMSAPAPGMSAPQGESSGATGSPGSINPSDSQKQPGSGSNSSQYQDQSQQR